MTHPNPGPVADLLEKLRRLLPKKAAVIGAYAYGAIVEPRETQDIDVLMARRSGVALAKKLAKVVPGVTWTEKSYVVEVQLNGLKAIDLVPAEHPLLKKVLDGELIERPIPRFGTARLPTVEGLIASKFLAVNGIWRGPAKKHRDIADLLDYWEAGKRRRLNRRSLDELLALVRPDAPADFARLIEASERGEMFTF